ncbi:hypothetical protein OG552_15830 [Streptomyces sp. NBC_01476]|uniref:effector-associated constant component EACC1 n=1 Tax=Streptomyces sp. NBC_01476 TaxID=2903881 RepID=UPI002E346376|nr:hypothetical protein [Streptomyces sp. NBC_01476]
MRLQIRAVGADGQDEIADFHRWLRQDEDGPEEMRLVSRTSGGSMGAVAVIDLVLTHAVALTNLGMLYANWRRARNSSGGARFTFTRPSDGLSVAVDDGSEESVRRLMAFLSAPEPAPDAAPGPTAGAAPDQLPPPEEP